MYFDAAYPHNHVKQVYIDGEIVNAAAADSEAGWVDQIVMNDGYTVVDGNGRPQTIRRYGNVQTYSIEHESLDLLLSFLSH